MNAEQQKSFDNIIAEWEKSYQKDRAEYGDEDTHVIRLAFYEACLTVLIEGPPLKSLTVKNELIKYYTNLRNEKVVTIFEQS
jgi:hypothetical protein